MLILLKSPIYPVDNPTEVPKDFVCACTRGKWQADSKTPRETQDRRPSIGKRPPHSHTHTATTAQAEVTASRPAPPPWAGLFLPAAAVSPPGQCRATPQWDLGRPVLPGQRGASALTLPLTQGCRQRLMNWV